MTTPNLAFGNDSHVGMVRKENQDYFGSFKTSAGELFVVCDGMGGHRGGSVASQLAVNAIGEFSSKARTLDPTEFLEHALTHAHKLILERSLADSELTGMGTTCVAFLVQLGEIESSRAWVASAGDSRLYRLRGGKLEQLTRDHSRVQELVDGGIISQQEASEHKARNIITRALGTGATVEVEIHPVEVRVGDRFILATDGIHGMLKTQELEKIASSSSDPQSCATDLVAAANRSGGDDNATVIVVDVTKGSRRSGVSVGRSKWTWLVLSGIVIAAIILAISFSGGGEDAVETQGEDTLGVPVPDTIPPAESRVDTLILEFSGDSFSRIVQFGKTVPETSFLLHADSTYVYTMWVEEASSRVDVRLSRPGTPWEQPVDGGFLHDWKAPETGDYLVAFETVGELSGEFTFVCERKPIPIEPEAEVVVPPAERTSPPNPREPEPDRGTESADDTTGSTAPDSGDGNPSFQLPYFSPLTSS